MKSLSDILIKISTSSNPASTCRYLSISEKQVLSVATSFLLESSTISQRIWHIRNDVWTVPHCPECSKTLQWNKSISRYPITCSVKCSRNSDDYFKKREQTYLKNLGVSHPSKSQIIQDKKKQTMQQRYGVDYPFQSNIVQTQMKNHWIKKYGVDNPRKSDIIKEKIKQTHLTNYKCQFSQQRMFDVIPLIEDYDWLFDQYINQNKSAWQIAEEYHISDVTIGNYLRKHEIAIKYNYGYSWACISWLDSIMKSENIHTQHALNGGEYLVPSTKFKADGYCAETNTIYEFHGDYWHGNPSVYGPEIINEVVNKSMGELYQKTIDKENKIKELGYNLVVMWESDWNANVNINVFEPIES